MAEKERVMRPGTCVQHVMMHASTFIAQQRSAHLFAAHTARHNMHSKGGDDASSNAAQQSARGGS